jgi:hypothetical protein
MRGMMEEIAKGETRSVQRREGDWEGQRRDEKKVRGLARKDCRMVTGAERGEMTT